MRLNVRCCCNPEIVIGTFEVPPGVYQRISIVPRLTVRGDILNPAWSPADILEVGEVRLADGRRERAIKSEDRPDAFWDTLKGFERALV